MTATFLSIPIVTFVMHSPQLTWRDMQHLVVETSVRINKNDGSWHVNGAGCVVLSF